MMGQPGSIWQPPLKSSKGKRRLSRGIFLRAGREVGNPQGLALALLDLEFAFRIAMTRREGGPQLAARLAALRLERQAALKTVFGRCNVASTRQSRRHRATINLACRGGAVCTSPRRIQRREGRRLFAEKVTAMLR